MVYVECGVGDVVCVGCGVCMYVMYVVCCVWYVVCAVWCGM